MTDPIEVSEFHAANQSRVIRRDDSRTGGGVESDCLPMHRLEPIAGDAEHWRREYAASPADGQLGPLSMSVCLVIQVESGHDGGVQG